MKAKQLILGTAFAAVAAVATTAQASNACEVSPDLSYSKLAKSESALMRGVGKACTLNTRGKVATVNPDVSDGILTYEDEGTTKFLSLSKSKRLEYMPTNDANIVAVKVFIDDGGYLFLSSPSTAKAIQKEWIAANEI